MRTSWPRTARVAVGMVLCIGLAACGSRLDPDQVVGLSAPGASTSVAPDGTVVDSTVPGTDPSVPGTDTGTGAGTDTSNRTGTDPGDAAEPPPGGSQDNEADGGQDAASCDGFKNQTGITDDKIVLSNVSDISGPVPGLFEASQQGAAAYIAYFNSTNDICGRKLELLNLDSRTDAGGDQQAYAKACAETFAAVGSMSGFDSGGAATAEQCGLPDVRATAVLPERQRCSTCFGAQAVDSTTFQNAVPDHILKTYPDAAKKAAMLYLNAGAAPPNATNQVNANERRGMNFVYVEGVDVAAFNYAPYVQRMKDAGVEYVQWIGPYQNAVRLRQAMQQQSFAPEVFALDPTGYTHDYVESGGSAVDGTRIFMNTALFDSSNPEMRLYLSWLEQVSPGAQPSYFGLYAWSASRLFVEQAVALGGGLTRDSMVQAMRKVDNWTSNDLHAPQHVGSKKTGECWRWIRLDGSRWVAEGSSKYTCSGVTSGA